MEPKDFQTLKENGPLPQTSAVDYSTIVEELWEPYKDSVFSLLHELEAAALELETTSDPQENGRKVMRLMHTIKGESAMTGLMDLSHLCHEAETAFGELKDHQPSEATDMVLRVKDWIISAIEYADTLDSFTEVQETENLIPKPKALIIDDDQICKKRLSMMLEPYFECTFAEHGKHGLELYKESDQENDRFVLLTLDINMPEMNGHETLAAIRDYEASKGILGLDGVKIIMTTSEQTTDHVFGAFREGCEAYVIKTYMADKLLEEIAKLGLLKESKNYSLM